MKKISERLYERYEYLATKYANKIFSYDNISFEYEDVLQEFKIKIFLAIKSYGRRYLKYRNGEASKPVPIKFYIEAALGNKTRDFIKFINRESYKVRIDDVNFDIGISDNNDINPSQNRFVINNIDLLEGLNGESKTVFSLYLRGYNNKVLDRITLKRKEIIDNQKNFLKNKYSTELFQSEKKVISYQINED